MNNQTRSARRVAVSRLILVLALIAIPSMPFTDRLATAETAAAPTAVAHVAESVTASKTEASAFDVTAWQNVILGGVDMQVFALALHAASVAVARGDASAPATLTVIDFSKPSTEQRLWVYDLHARKLLFEEVVSHGRGSGKTLATDFSNRESSNQSSLGLYRTAETYIGKHGYSLRLDGLDVGFNDNARARAIVMHAADYVNPALAKANGYLGRSLGCPAVRPEISRALIDSIKQGGLLFAYYPDQRWLTQSAYLT